MLPEDYNPSQCPARPASQRLRRLYENIEREIAKTSHQDDFVSEIQTPTSSATKPSPMLLERCLKAILTKRSISYSELLDSVNQSRGLSEAVLKDAITFLENGRFVSNKDGRFSVDWSASEEPNEKIVLAIESLAVKLLFVLGDADNDAFFERLLFLVLKGSHTVNCATILKILRGLLDDGMIVPSGPSTVRLWHFLRTDLDKEFARHPESFPVLSHSSDSPSLWSTTSQATTSPAIFFKCLMVVLQKAPLSMDGILSSLSEESSISRIQAANAVTMLEEEHFIRCESNLFAINWDPHARNDPSKAAALENLAVSFLFVLGEIHQEEFFRRLLELEIASPNRLPCGVVKAIIDSLIRDGEIRVSPAGVLRLDDVTRNLQQKEFAQHPERFPKLSS
jgi:hypothetical protein